MRAICSPVARGMHADYAGPAKSFDSGRAKPIGLFFSTQVSEGSPWIPHTVTHCRMTLMVRGPGKCSQVRHRGTAGEMVVVEL